MPYKSTGMEVGSPSRSQYLTVGVLASTLIFLTAFLWPQADTHGPVQPVFVGIQQTAVLSCDFLTATLLFNHFIQHRNVNLLILACGYLFTSIIVSIHLVSFPGLMSPDWLVGGEQTPAWLWNIWHSVFPATVFIAAINRRPLRGNPYHAVYIAVAITIGTIVAASIFAIGLSDYFPRIIENGTFTPFYIGVVYPVVALFSVVALASLLPVRTNYTVVTLYLSLAALAFLIDVLVTWHAGARYTYGWYFGRANGFVASMSLCILFIIEYATLLRAANLTAVQLGELNEALEATSLAKSRFFAAASHDLRQPFQAMRLFFEVLKTMASDRQTPAIERLGQAMGTAENLLNELLDVARLENGAVKPKFEEVNLGQLVAELEAELLPVAITKRLALKVRHTPAIVNSDPFLLKRILFNIAVNALRYTNHGGVLIGLRQRPGRVVVEVWDTGIGIAEDQASLIYEDFYQVDNSARDRAQGTGLGLAIVKRLSELLHCEVTVASRLGHGTVFRVAIPVASDQSPDHAQVQLDFPHQPFGHSL